MTAAARPLTTNGVRPNDLATLARTRVGSRLDARDFGTWLEQLDEIMLEPGEALPADGAEAYFVLEGEIRATSTNESQTLRTGDDAELRALVGSASRAALEAASSARLARWPRTRLDAFAASHPATAFRWMSAIAAALAEARVAASGSTARIDRIALPSDREAVWRSIGLLCLESLARIAPEKPARWGPRVGPAHVVRLPTTTLAEKQALAIALERALARHVEEATPLREEVVDVPTAERALARQGWSDAVSLLAFHRDDHVQLVRCGGLVAPSTGPVLATAASLGRLRVVAHAEGLLVDASAHVGEAAPGRRHDTRIDPMLQETATPRFGGEMAAAQRAWLTPFGIENVGDLDRLCVEGRLDELVRVAEGFHEKSIAKIADAIVERRGEGGIVRIAGPSSSGKTTFIQRLVVQLEIAGLRTVTLSLDDYFVDREKTPRDANGDYDFESVDALDRRLLEGQVAALTRGEAVRPARFDFTTGRSLEHAGPEIRLRDGGIVLVEGLHALDASLLGDGAGRASFGVFVHPATTLPLDRLNDVSSEDVRLLRRIVRDRHQRGYSAAETIARFEAVRLAEQVNVFSCEPFADAVFDSSLVYELSVTKVYAERHLLEVPRGHASFPTALRLRRLLDRFVAVHGDHVPQNSILREFIGGSGFAY